MDDLVAGQLVEARPVVMISPERWIDFYPEALPLMALHRIELKQDDPRAPLILDHLRIEATEAAGGLLLIGARYCNDLVGYSIWYLVFSLETAGLKMALQAPWYVHPNFRGHGVGLRLLNFAERELRRLGVRLIHGHLPEEGPGAGLWPLFARKGAKRLGVEFSMWLDPSIPLSEEPPLWPA